MKRNKLKSQKPVNDPGTYAELQRFLAYSTTTAVIEQVRRGLPSTILASLIIHFSITPNQLAALLNISPSTVKRKIQNCCILSASLTEKVMRIGMVELESQKIFSRERSIEWLKTPSAFLNGEAPIEWLDTEFGAREITKSILLIRNGGVV